MFVSGIIVLHLVQDYNTHLVQEFKTENVHLVQENQNLIIFLTYGIINKKYVGVFNMDNVEKMFDSTKYKNDFQKEKYDRIIVNVPKGQKSVIDNFAKSAGYKSLNAFVVDAINEKMN